MGAILDFRSWTFDDLLSPLRDIPIVFLQLIQYFCQFLPSSASSTKATIHAQPNGADLNKKQQRSTGPLLAFSYAGMLWSYYLGAVAFLRDHFDLHQSNICLSGISAGCSSVMVIFLDLTIEQGFEFGLEWSKLFDSRLLKFFALSTSQTLNMIINKFHKFGITDQVLKDKYNKYGGSNAIHFGVTAFQLSKLRIFHLLLNNFTTLRQTVYAALCSMRIVPFFRSFGFYNGYYCCDGAMTSNYSIPEIYRHKEHKDKVIKIGVLSNKLVSSDISPQKNFYLNEFIIAGSLKDNLIRFDKGYKDAAQFGNILTNYIRKGLVWNNQHIEYERFNDKQYRKEWSEYVDDRIKHWNKKIIVHIEDCEVKEQ